MSDRTVNPRGLLGRRRQLDKDLELCRAKLRVLFDNVSSGVVIYKAVGDGEDFVFADFNPAAEQIEQIKKEQLIGKSVREVFPGVVEFGLFDVFKRVWKTGTPEHHPVSTYKDERIAGWRENYVFRLPSGEVVAVYDDVTEHKHSELAIRMSEQCFRAIADYTYSWEVWIGPQGRPLWTNPAVRRVTGYTPAEIMAMSDYPAPIIYEKDRERMARAFAFALKGGTGNDVLFRIRRKDDRIIWAEMSWQPIFDEKGVSLGHRQSIRDVTARKEAEDALKRAEHEKELILDSLAEQVLHEDLDMAILWANRAACESAGMTRDQLIGRRCYEIWADRETPREQCPAAKAITSGRTQRAEKQTPDGKLWFIQASPVRNEDGQIVGSVEIVLEITDPKHPARVSGECA